MTEQQRIQALEAALKPFAEFYWRQRAARGPAFERDSYPLCLCTKPLPHTGPDVQDLKRAAELLGGQP